MTTTATERQIAYARQLQADIRERITWEFNRDTVRGSFTPELNPETMARVRALRAEGRRDEAKALTAEARADQRAAADAAIDAYLVRRQELADADIDSMDRDQISAYIDDAKRAIF
ncbi:hypothetical protein H7I53_18020 [Mycolicibacterium pulveris]|uniref:Uncharacterized protein n=1 Tax=Mycolicibacterium pulveris TaxID=36813 RepID=A0A7I7UC69_MYCPV|nr:hypothetical protein [Mycolicibacterium pulveris]MCV6982112.1 hypothetical protein [Mycolicibacterium pulveris]BBY78845.1 hypothetical protein MPUL_00030 [Mycolicibacterium pulveris]